MKSPSRVIGAANKGWPPAKKMDVVVMMKMMQFDTTRNMKDIKGANELLGTGTAGHCILHCTLHCIAHPTLLYPTLYPTLYRASYTVPANCSSSGRPEAIRHNVMPELPLGATSTFTSSSRAAGASANASIINKPSRNCTCQNT